MEQTPQENDHQIEQNIESDNSFDAKLKSGENNIREIFDNDVKASDIHPELALLFSSIDPNDVAEVEPDRTSNKIKVTEYGIKINDEIYPYNDSMKEQVFLYETKRLMGKSEDLQDMYGNLEEERTSLRDAYIERIQNTYIDKAKEPHLKKIKEYEEKIKSGYAKNTIFTAANQVIREMFDDDQLSDVGCKLVYADAFSCQEKDKAVSNGQYQLSEAKKDGEYLSKTIEKDRQRRQGEAERKAKKEFKKQIKEHPELKDEEMPPVPAVGYTALEIQEKENKEKAVNQKEIYLKNKEISRDAFVERMNEKYGVEEFNYRKIIDESRKRLEENKVKFIVENGFMSQEELDEYKGIHNKLLEAGNIVKTLKRERPSGEYKALNNTLDEYRALERAIRAELSEKFEEEHSGDQDYLGIKSVFRVYKQVRNNKGVIIDVIREDEKRLPSVEEEKEKVLELSKKASIPDSKGLLDRMTGLMYRKYELAVKYRRGEIKFGSVPAYITHSISEKKDEMNKQMLEVVAPEAKVLAEESADQVGAKIAERLFSEESVKDVFFNSAGCFVRHYDDKCTTHIISPFDERVVAALSPEESEAWTSAWEARRNSQTKQNDGNFIDFMNDYIRETVQKNTNAINIFYTNKLIGSAGDLNHLPTADEQADIEKILPSISRFITRVDFNAVREDVHHDISVRGLLANLKSEVAGNMQRNRFASPSDLIDITEDGSTLKYSFYKKIIEETGDENKAKSVLYSCMGFRLYKALNKEKIQEFSHLLGDKINVSKQVIYKNYGVVVDSPLKRREISAKTYFISEFSKFANNQASPEFTDYFNSISSEDYA